MKFFVLRNARIKANAAASGNLPKKKSFDIKVFLMKRKLQRELAVASPKDGRIKKKKFVPRLVYPKKDPKLSMWWEYVLGGTWADMTGRDGKAFRQRFRVTHEFFLNLVVRAKELFPNHAKRDAVGKKPAPIELKVLGVLRVLGRGVCFDDCAEATNMNKETHRRFFHSFCRKFASKYYSIYCRGPESDAELDSCMSEYTSAGFPGCLGSTDGVHVSWDRCHAQQKMLHTGKEKYPTVAYNVTVNHRRWIMAVSRGFFGSYNDKTIVKYDPFISDIHKGKKYQNYKFDLRKRGGGVRQITGAWILCDGGYHRWRCLQCPSKDGSSNPERKWSKWAESLRKDVECCFGILKGRWRILKTGIRLQSREIIDSVFYSCAILHNMLMEYDGLHEEWNAGVQYDGVDGLHDKDDMKLFFGRLHVNAKIDLSKVGHVRAHQAEAVEEEDDTEYDATFRFLNEALIEHFDVICGENGIKWPRRK